MCGIVGAVARRQVSAILLEGLERLEYRGYDSAGMATLRREGALDRRRRLGKVRELAAALEAHPLEGTIGIAHTRWATHGAPSELNAHPHCCDDRVALVHNGIIENWEGLCEALTAAGYQFESGTDTEVIAHLIDHESRNGGELAAIVRRVSARLEGAFAFVAMHRDHPGQLVGARRGSPLVVGVGIGENFLASDLLALRPVTDRFAILEEGDTVEISADAYRVWDARGEPVERDVERINVALEELDRGDYRHHMEKEIHEQPDVVRRTLEGRVARDYIMEPTFGRMARTVLDATEAVTIVACGTSYYAGLVARYWFESIAGVPCTVEIASEFRYRDVVVRPGTVLLTISQSGETADTLAALRKARGLGYAYTATICNVATSAMVRESDLAVMLEAGIEVGVASTKAFTAQLVDLLLLAILIGRRYGLPREREAELVLALNALPEILERTLKLDTAIAEIAEHLLDRQHALFLGRGSLYPVALEGALKLKEISYIHAEGYAAGELKHGPLALVDDEMPVVAVAPNDDMVEKLHANLQEVRARGGERLVFADPETRLEDAPGAMIIRVPHVIDVLSPIVYTLPLQLLAYNVAQLKGTDVDQPRNLAKSVTVE